MLARGIAGYADVFPDGSLSSWRALDHAEFYRTKDRKAAAIAAHLYDFERKAEACSDLAARYGLVLELPDIPSWYLPGRTRTVLYLGPQGRKP
jgi:hypothetical protein